MDLLNKLAQPSFFIPLYLFLWLFEIFFLAKSPYKYICTRLIAGSFSEAEQSMFQTRFWFGEKMKEEGWANLFKRSIRSDEETFLVFIFWSSLEWASSDVLPFDIIVLNNCLPLNFGKFRMNLVWPIFIPGFPWIHFQPSAESTLALFPLDICLHFNLVRF